MPFPPYISTDIEIYISDGISTVILRIFPDSTESWSENVKNSIKINNLTKLCQDKGLKSYKIAAII